MKMHLGILICLYSVESLKHIWRYVLKHFIILYIIVLYTSWLCKCNIQNEGLLVLWTCAANSKSLIQYLLMLLFFMWRGCHFSQHSRQPLSPTHFLSEVIFCMKTVMPARWLQITNVFKYSFLSQSSSSGEHVWNAYYAHTVYTHRLTKPRQNISNKAKAISILPK